MSKRTFKKLMERNKVMAIPIPKKKEDEPQKYRLVDIGRK